MKRFHRQEQRFIVATFAKLNKEVNGRLGAVQWRGPAGSWRGLQVLDAWIGWLQAQRQVSTHFLTACIFSS
jgi:hypothetical protein